nr:polysaccharide pyruvyl transferase family protein [Clostridium paraputrificum]
MNNKQVNKLNLWGYYGCNYGDNIMMKILIDYINSEFVDMDINVYEVYHGIDKSLVEEKAKINKFKLNKYNFVANIMKIKKMCDNSINIWGGGTIFTDSDGDGFFRVFSYLKYLKIPFGYVSVGIGDMQRKSRILKTKFLLENCSFCFLREEHSYRKAIKKLGISKEKLELTDDLVSIYINDYLERSNYNLKKKEDYLLISWRNLERYINSENQNQLINYCIDLIKAVTNEKKISKIIVLPLDVRNDVECSKPIKKLLENEGFNVELICETNPDKLTEIIKKSSFHISGRLHGSLISELLDVDTVSIIYSNKMEYLYKELNKMNFINVKMCLPDMKQVLAESKIRLDKKKYLEKNVSKAKLNLLSLKANIIKIRK